MELSEKVLNDLKQAAKVFDNAFSSFDAKITFIKNVYDDKQYPYICSHRDEIKNALMLLGKNAKEPETRKIQQKHLAPLIQMFMTNPNKQDLTTYFNNNPFYFAIFCLTYVHFQEETLSEKEKQAHDFLLKHLETAVKKLVN